MANGKERERGPQVGFSVPQDLSDALEDVRQKTGMNISHLGREALWGKVDEIRRTHPAYANERAEMPTAEAAPA